MFKVGDKVRCIAYPGDGLTGLVGIVKNICYGVTDRLFYEVAFEGRTVEAPSVGWYMCNHELELVKEQEFVPEHNRLSDTVAEIMENENFGRWFHQLEKQTGIDFLRCHAYGDALSLVCYGNKEIFFTLLWLVDDETLDHILEELRN